MALSRDTVLSNLKNAGLELPSAAAPAANYVPWLIADGTLMISGQLPMRGGGIAVSGVVGREVELAEATLAAQICAVNILAQVDAAVDGDWGRVQRCLKLGGFVASTPDFTDQPKVINGASNLMVEVLGDAGRHTRFAVGAAALPLGAAVEIEAVFLVAD